MRIVYGEALHAVYFQFGKRGRNGWKPVVALSLSRWALPVAVDYARHDDGKYFCLTIQVLCAQVILNHYSGY